MFNFKHKVYWSQLPALQHCKTRMCEKYTSTQTGYTGLSNKWYREIETLCGLIREMIFIFWPVYRVHTVYLTLTKPIYWLILSFFYSYRTSAQSSWKPNIHMVSSHLSTCKGPSITNMSHCFARVNFDSHHFIDSGATLYLSMRFVWPRTEVTGSSLAGSVASLRGYHSAANTATTQVYEGGLVPSRWSVVEGSPARIICGVVGQRACISMSHTQTICACSVERILPAAIHAQKCNCNLSKDYPNSLYCYVDNLLRLAKSAASEKG